MAIYRPPKARWPLAVAAGITSLLVGLLIGIAVGSEDFDPASAGSEIRTRLAAASGSLDVAEVEYAESVSGGRVTKEAEYSGAMAAVASSRERFEEISPALSAFAPSVLDEIDDLYTDIEAAMESVADPSEVTALLERLRSLLEGNDPP